MPDLVALLAERKRLLACPWDEFDPVRLADIDDALIGAIPDLLEAVRRRPEELIACRTNP
jgi:hypothetical protein